MAPSTLLLLYLSSPIQCITIRQQSLSVPHSPCELLETSVLDSVRFEWAGSIEIHSRLYFAVVAARLTGVNQALLAVGVVLLSVAIVTAVFLVVLEVKYG